MAYIIEPYIRPLYLTVLSLALYNAGHTSPEKHVSEAEPAAAGFRTCVGTPAVALHCAATPPSEQCRVTRADIGP